MSKRKMQEKFYYPPQDTLLNVLPSGKPPAKRVVSVDAARQIYDDCVLDAEPIARARARIRGLVDGNPPYDPAELKRMGQGWRTNFNVREAEAIIDTNSSALWEMQHDTFIAARFRAIDPTNSYSAETGLDYGDIIAQEYTRVLRDWDEWQVYTDLTIHDAMEAGMGVMLWGDSSGILPKWYNISNLVFPKNASCNISDLDFFFVRDEVPVHRLFRVVENEKAATEEGWNVTAVKEYLVQLFGFGSNPGRTNYEDEYRMSGWEAIQQMIKNNDAGVQRAQFEGVSVLHLFVREVDGEGGITHVIFTEDDVSSSSVDASFAGANAPDTRSFTSSFLFENHRQYGDMSQVLWWLLYSYGDGYLNSVKGLGHRITPHCEVSNRLICSTFDSGILSSSLLLKPQTAVDFSKISILRVGPFTYLPENMEAVQTSFNPRVDGLVMLRQMSSAILDNNTGVFRVRNENPLRGESEKTARQVMAEESKEARFEKNQAAYFYVQWDFFHREIFRRLCSVKKFSVVFDAKEKKIAQSFKDRCIARGVPDTLLKPEVWEVRAERAIGLGAPGMRLDVTGQMLQIKGMMPEENQIHAIREYIAARVGAQHVDRFVPLQPKSVFASDAASIATLENNDFNEGSWVPVGSDQMHAIHLPIHFAPLMQAAEAMSKDPGSIDVREVYKVFTVALPHIQQHLGFLSQSYLPGDMEGEAKVGGFQKLYSQLNQLMGRLQGVIKQMQQAEARKAQEQQNQVQKLMEEADNRKYEVEKYKVDRDAEIKRYEADLLHQSRMAKTNTQIESTVRRVLSDLQNKAMLTNAEIQSKMRKTTAEIQAAAEKNRNPRESE